MKIRQGFVSNSSTSSFILVGITITNEKDAKKVLGWDSLPWDRENPYDANDEDTNGFDVEVDYDNRTAYVGDVLSSGEGFFGGDEIDLNAVQEAMMSHSSEKLKMLGYTPKLLVAEISS